MDERLRKRLGDIVEAITKVELLLFGRGFEALENVEHLQRTFERYLEIISEASRHIPDQMKQERSDIPWRNIAGVGNVLRHGYDGVDSLVLWETYSRGELLQIKNACLHWLEDKPG